MTALRLAAAAAAVLYGLRQCSIQKQPLFFKILLFGCSGFLLGAVFEGCWYLVYGTPPQGFHIGCLGDMGGCFFLLSAHYGAINRLADGGEKQYRPYRLAGLIPSALALGLCLWSLAGAGVSASLPLLLMALPIAPELYFAGKLLLLPDVDMGIIQGMRPYNFCVLVLCFGELTARLPVLPAGARMAGAALQCLLLVLCLPAAERGVKKWYT